MLGLGGEGVDVVSMVLRSEVEVALEAVSGAEVAVDGFLLLVL